jgi:HSP20 family protein
MSEKKDRWLAMRPFLNFPMFEEDFYTLPFAHQSGLSVSEDKDHVYVEADLPGLKAEDIEVTFEKGVLWIRGEKNVEEKKKKIYRQASRSFSYRVHVPGAIDEKREPEATYKDGVMKVCFSKSSDTHAKKINFKTK